MSSPWCQPPETSARGAPKLSPKDTVPTTGNTYPWWESWTWTFGGPVRTGPPGIVAPPAGSGGAGGCDGVDTGGAPTSPRGGLVDCPRDGAATAVTSTAPTTISLPATSPPWAAVSRTRSATTDPSAAGERPRRLETDCESTCSVPQSANATLEPGLAGTS